MLAPSDVPNPAADALAEAFRSIPPMPLVRINPAEPDFYPIEAGTVIRTIPHTDEEVTHEFRMRFSVCLGMQGVLDCEPVVPGLTAIADTVGVSSTSSDRW